MMSDVIDFLERMGQNAGLRYGSRAEVEIALEDEDFEPLLQVTILARDHAKLERALGQGVRCCLLFPVKEDEEVEEGGEGDDEEPSRDDEDVSSSRRFPVAACTGKLILHARRNRSWFLAGLLCSACRVVSVSFAGAPAKADAAQLLKRADSLKTSNHAEFSALMKQLSGAEMVLSPQEQLYLRYLRGFQIGYGGDYDSAISLLNSVIEQSTDPTLRFRAGATSVNLLEISAHYEEAFSRLHQLLVQIPGITDKAARLQVISIATQLYIEAGQYDLAMQYADQLVSESPAGASACRSETLRLQVLYKSQKLQSLGTQFQSGIESCVKASEPIFASAIRSFVAGFELQHDRADEA